MVEIMGVYNSLIISAVTAMKNPETLRFAPDKAILENGST